VPALAYQAFEPLARWRRGVPVFVVPGNHERGRLPRVALAVHPRLHVFDRPRTFVTEIRGTTLALSGFPYERRSVRTEFPRLLEAAGWRSAGAALRLVCMHQCAEGATVGPGNFTFRSAADVVRLGDVPPAFAAVLSGHIHRPQVLSTDLGGRRLAGPVLYPDPSSGRRLRRWASRKASWCTSARVMLTPACAGSSVASPPGR
jgi:hypothetical protein